MPLYGYTCQACGHDFDRLHKIADPAPPCPACGTPNPLRQVSAAAVRLKGTGWYETDFKKESEGRRNLVLPKENP